MSSEFKDVYVGIDLAIARNKRIPVAICYKKEGYLIPFELKSLRDIKPPHGIGNRGALEDNQVIRYSHDIVEYVELIKREKRLNIKTIAIDAPSDYKGENN